MKRQKRRRRRRPRTTGRASDAARSQAPKSPEPEVQEKGESLWEKLEEVEKHGALNEEGRDGIARIRASEWPDRAAAEIKQFDGRFNHSAFLNPGLADVAKTIELSQRYKTLTVPDTALQVYEAGLDSVAEAAKLVDLFETRSETIRQAGGREDPGQAVWDASDEKTLEDKGLVTFMELRRALGEQGWTSRLDREMLDLIGQMRGSDDAIRTLVTKMIQLTATVAKQWPRTERGPGAAPDDDDGIHGVGPDQRAGKATRAAERPITARRHAKLRDTIEKSGDAPAERKRRETRAPRKPEQTDWLDSHHAHHQAGAPAGEGTTNGKQRRREGRRPRSARALTQPRPQRPGRKRATRPERGRSDNDRAKPEAQRNGRQKARTHGQSSPPGLDEGPNGTVRSAMAIPIDRGNRRSKRAAARGREAYAGSSPERDPRDLRAKPALRRRPTGLHVTLSKTDTPRGCGRRRSLRESLTVAPHAGMNPHSCPLKLRSFGLAPRSRG